MIYSTVSPYTLIIGTCRPVKAPPGSGRLLLRWNMAIDKAVENEYGAAFTYHKLRDVRVINNEKGGVQVVMNVYSWINKQARIDGKQPTIRQCIIDNADFAMTPFYALLKAKFEEFSDGADDFNNDFKGNKQPLPMKMIEQTLNGKLFKKVVE